MLRILVVVVMAISGAVVDMFCCFCHGAVAVVGVCRCCVVAGGIVAVVVLLLLLLLRRLPFDAAPQCRRSSLPLKSRLSLSLVLCTLSLRADRVCSARRHMEHGNRGPYDTTATKPSTCLLSLYSIWRLEGKSIEHI